MANLQLPLNQDHEVLGSEYCSGYMDALGKWNTGFYCPASDESQDVFCCGTEYHKYCCTKKDQVIQSEVQDLTVLVGIIVGASAAILILTMVSCFCCSCCLLYKKRHPNSASMYRLHNSSEHSGVTNMYSLSNAGGSRANTPTNAMVTANNTSVNAMRPASAANLTEVPMGAGSYLMDDSLLGLSNGGLSHSYTLPHNLSSGGGILTNKNFHQGHGHHHFAGHGQGHMHPAGHQTLNRYSYHHRDTNPDLIASAVTHQHPTGMPQQQHVAMMPGRDYGTLGRLPGAGGMRKAAEHPPPYPDFNAYGQMGTLPSNHELLVQTVDLPQQQQQPQLEAPSQPVSAAGVTSAVTTDATPAISTTATTTPAATELTSLSALSAALGANSSANPLFSGPAPITSTAEDAEGQLFHSTKF